MEQYYSLRFPSIDIKKEVIIAWLDMYDFDMMMEEKDAVIGYIAHSKYEDLDLESLRSSLNIEASDIEIKEIEQKNWNAEWESNFEPIIVEDQIYIRAPFHDESEAYSYVINIEPKMAFGTGHHETTYMMLQQMLDIDFEGKSVFDFGCGTGILAVFALQKKAAEILAIDIEEASHRNAKEHLQLNGFEAYTNNVHQGELSSIDTANKYDIILANINRNVLSQCAENLSNHLNEKGLLLISGILKTDEEFITELYGSVGLQLTNIIQRGEWLCFKFYKAQNDFNS